MCILIGSYTLRADKRERGGGLAVRIIFIGWDGPRLLPTHGEMGFRLLPTHRAML
jgi:hypothetical protein